MNDVFPQLKRKRESAEGQEKSKKKKKKSRHASLKPQPIAKWNMSDAYGGWFLPIDPVFSNDEEYLIIASCNSIQIYAVDTSALTKTLCLSGSGVVTAYALSNTNPAQLYIAESSGVITLWNWMDGSQIAQWEVGATVQALVVVSAPESDEDLIYTHEVGTDFCVNIHALRTKDQSLKTEMRRVLRAQSPICGMQVVMQGKYVVVTCEDSVIVAKRTKFSQETLSSYKYVCRELKFSKRLVACDTYIQQPVVSGKNTKTSHDTKDILDVALGDETGVIFVFQDILSGFAAVEHRDKQGKENTVDTGLLRPKKLHWHRDAVGAVKWSRDGRYLISGGGETVLTIWQLKTAKMQHLPHLTAAIEHVAVSPSGAAYAVTLANNSVIVLSTTELEAKTNIIGVQSRRLDIDPRHFKASVRKHNSSDLTQIPMDINPKHPNDLIFPVPSSQPRWRKENIRPEPYLQTYDLANHRAKTRQAITRNNATDVNLSPEGGIINEPSIKHVQVGHDGEWLATVDEWMPLPMESYHVRNSTIYDQKECAKRREVYLKIWKHDSTNQQWNLSTRIDAPHLLERTRVDGQVFDLVTDPNNHGFATVGDDHTIRIWRPKTRIEEGMVVRGVQRTGLVVWSLDCTIELGDALDTAENSQKLPLSRISRLAFSADSSILAAAVSRDSQNDSGLIRLIDPKSGKICRTISEINAAGLSAIGIVHEHLVVVGNVITVWDMVSDQLVYSLPTQCPSLEALERVPLTRLSTNEIDRTFAVAIPDLGKGRPGDWSSSEASYKVHIYETIRSNPLWSEVTPGIVLALTSRRGERGYVFLDSSSSIKIISPNAKALLPSMLVNGNTDIPDRNLTIEESKEEKPGDEKFKALKTDRIELAIENDKPVINQQALQAILDTGAAPLPPHRLFSAVLALVGRPPKVAG